jgi:hypothetical protein
MRSAIQIMNSTIFKNFVFFNYLSLDYKITKLNACKIEHKLNIKIFIWDW